MVNITEYMKEKGIYNPDLIRGFLKMSRVKYFIGNDKKVIAKTGRHNSYTMFSEDLFELFLSWLEKKPIPILNRKEYEVQNFILAYFGVIERQYPVDSFIFDWYVPEFNLLIEFNEKAHNQNTQYKESDILKKERSEKSFNFFVINEKTVMQDIAILAKKYRPK